MGTISRSCPGACPAKHNPSGPLVLQLALPAASQPGATLRWSSPDGDLPEAGGTYLTSFAYTVDPDQVGELWAQKDRGDGRRHANRRCACRPTRRLAGRFG